LSIKHFFQGLVLLAGFTIGGVAFSDSSAVQPCNGKFPNPISDICWDCLFPIKIGSFTLSTPDQKDNSDPPPPLFCTCPAPPPLFVRVGVGISFWEPARMAEIVRTPMCSPTLGGVRLGTIPAPAGTHSQGGDDQTSSFYHVHWFSYPVLSWLGMAFTSTACQEGESFDMLYMSELDPLWDSDESSFLLNPESVLFTNPVAQAACAADSVSATLTNFGIDMMFWCAGSQGSVYPLTGTIANHGGGVDASLDILHRFTFKMHREMLGMDTSTTAAMCHALPQPLLRKQQYKQQMVYPISQTTTGLGYGVPMTIWGSGKEFPYKGEDYGYLVWRKRKCCSF
jgi:conjugal transfer pilus assembly protein TraU